MRIPSSGTWQNPSLKKGSLCQDSLGLVPMSTWVPQKQTNKQTTKKLFTFLLFIYKQGDQMLLLKIRPKTTKNRPKSRPTMFFC
jgi:hypothetical protein